MLGCFANIASHALMIAGWYTGRGGIEIDRDLIISSLGCSLLTGGISIDERREDTSFCLGSGGEYEKGFCVVKERDFLTS